MNVMVLRVDAVFMKAGSYVISPKSSGPVRTWRRSMARTAPSLIGISYDLPVRLSRTVSVSLPIVGSSRDAVCARTGPAPHRPRVLGGEMSRVVPGLPQTTQQRRNADGITGEALRPTRGVFR